MSSPQWRFADFRLDPDNACLWRGTQPLALTPKAFDVLQYLVTHADRLVTKDTLLDAVWPETAISDAVVRIAIGELRRVLGDTAQAPRFIATVYRRGYRFVAPVAEHTEPSHALVAPPPVAFASPEAERRRLTVLFCDLVNSTTLAGHLDPEDLREVVRTYHQTCAAVIHQYGGYIAQYLGDGVLVYFGYPVAHEDDAQRAVRAGLGMLRAMDPLNTRLTLSPGDRVAVRLGIHTGLVVIGEVGEGARHEPLALGETPNLAARLQGLAAPNTLVISAAIWQLLGGFFICRSLGPVRLKGIAQPLEVYQVLAETTARSRLEAARSTGLTPLVGREQEVGLLRERWAQVKDGMGQVVLLSGEAGIGKSRLVQMLQDSVATESQAWLTPCQCVPYYQNTALYPLIDLLERVVLRFDREESSEQKLRTLEGYLGQYGLPLAEAVPLLASLLSIPLTADYASLPMSPEQQKRHTLHTLLTILLRSAAQQPVLFVMEDLHWVDPTTLEFLSLLVDQGPTARILALWTFRPDFPPPWMGRSHFTQVTLSRLPQRQAAEMTGRVAHGKALPAEVVEQIVTKTDGVPLFVEELTKMVLESGLLQEREERYALTGPLPPLAIPATLQDALMARLDQLASAKAVAQLGATLGREFTYELLRAMAPMDELELWRGLVQLVQAEVLYQRGALPQASYLFKHALIQEAAYQSLLKRTRQQYHQRIAQVLTAQFPETMATQPELLAWHYTEAGLQAQALPYWHQAGQRAIARSAYTEACQHLTTGLEVLATVPETPTRHQHELDLLTALNLALRVTKGYGVPELESGLIRAEALSQQVGDLPQRFAVLLGLWSFRIIRTEFQTALAVAEQLLDLAQRQRDPTLLLRAHHVLGQSLYEVGAFALARTHLEQGIALSNLQPHVTPPTTPWWEAQNLGVRCRAVCARILWELGYPDQAVQWSQEALTMAHTLARPYDLVDTLFESANLHRRRREWQMMQAHVEAGLALATEHGFARYVVLGALHRGMALAAQGQAAEGIVQMRQGLAALRATGTASGMLTFLAHLAAAYGQVGQVDEGLHLLAEALAVVDTTVGRPYEAELHRLHGELLLQQPIPDAPAAEACFQRALAVARRQQAKSWELRAAMSLAQLWQLQGKRAEARALLAPIYGWFTEGFDTADLLDAQTLLRALATEP